MKEPKQMYMPMVFAHLAVGDADKNTDYTKKEKLLVENINEEEFRKRLNKTMCFVSGRAVDYSGYKKRIPVMFFDGYCCTVAKEVIQSMHRYNRGTYNELIDEVFSLDGGSISNVRDLAFKYFYNYGLKSSTSKIESWKYVYYKDYDEVKPFFKDFSQNLPTTATRIVDAITGSVTYKYTRLPYLAASWIWIFGITKDIKITEEDHNVVMQLDKDKLMKNTFIYDICKCEESLSLDQPKTLDEYFSTDSSKHKVYKVNHEPFFYDMKIINDKMPNLFYKDIVSLACYNNHFKPFSLRKRYSDVEKEMLNKYNKTIFKFSLGQHESQLEVFDTYGCGLDMKKFIYGDDDLIKNFVELSRTILSDKAIMITSTSDMNYRKIQKYIIPENLVNDSIKNNIPTEITLKYRHIHIKKWNNEVTIETALYCGKGKKYDIDKLVELLGRFKPLIDDDYINMIVAKEVLEKHL